MIKPEYERLARLYGPSGPALFTSVDAEASRENAALAAEAQIRGFPTFHFYRNMARAPPSPRPHFSSSTSFFLVLDDPALLPWSQRKTADNTNPGEGG